MPCRFLSQRIQFATLKKKKKKSTFSRMLVFFWFFFGTGLDSNNNSTADSVVAVCPTVCLQNFAVMSFPPHRGYRGGGTADKEAEVSAAEKPKL